jgi:flagellar hook protein FlgE
MVFNTAISGINAATNDLSVTGNNIANSATTGFKQSRAEFADVYSSNTIGSGVQLSDVKQTFSQGTINFTNNDLDLAINGQGFFILNDGGSNVYSRAGSFGVDNQGFITNSLNQTLTGLTADSSGNITGATGSLQIDSSNISPQATSTVTTALNVTPDAVSPAVDWVGGASPAATTYNNISSSTIYDSLGNSHVLSMYLINADSAAVAGAPNAASPAGTNNQWYAAFQIDNQNVPANAGAQNTNNLYRLNFNNDGSFNNVTDTANAPVAQNQIPLGLTLTNGAAPLSFTLDLSNSTQFSSPFAVLSHNQNGFTTGRLDSLDIDGTGVISGRYTNGQTKAMGQVQLANFTNVNGLDPLGDTSWGETAASGQPLVSIPGSGSLGGIQSGGLEQSNVDLTLELVNLITAQRNFQANAQTIRTADALAQTIINLR